MNIPKVAALLRQLADELEAPETTIPPAPAQEPAPAAPTADELVGFCKYFAEQIGPQKVHAALKGLPKTKDMTEEQRVQALAILEGLVK